LPVPIIVALAPLVWWFFRKTWRELDHEAQQYRGALLASGGYDLRPAVMLVMVAMILTLQEYYGGRSTYDDVIRPWLSISSSSGSHAHQLARYDELYGYAWWSFTRFAGYVILPFPAYKFIFGRTACSTWACACGACSSTPGIYGVCLLFVLPAIWLVSRQPDFGTYYPFYKNASRSYFDLLVWRGCTSLSFSPRALLSRPMARALRRSLGSGAIFSMCVPTA